MEATDCFAVPGNHSSIIDMVHPGTGKSWCCSQTLDEIRARYPGAELMKFDDWQKSAAIAQEAEPMDWKKISEETYHEMLNVLPPAGWVSGAFLVGEAVDHCFTTGRPRFACYKCENGQHFELARPITHKQFCEMFGKCPNNYIT